MEPEVATEMVAAVPESPLHPALPEWLKRDLEAQAFVKSRIQKLVVKTKPSLKGTDWSAYSLTDILNGNFPGVDAVRYKVWLDKLCLEAQYLAKLSEREQLFTQQVSNASLYVPSALVRCRVKPTPKNKKGDKDASFVTNLFLRRLMANLAGRPPARNSELAAHVVRTAGVKHLVEVQAEGTLQAPGLLHAVAKLTKIYDPANPPIVAFESQAMTPVPFVKKAQDVIMDRGYIPVEGRKGFQHKDASGEASWYFQRLIATFGDAVAFMSYVLSLTSPLLPNGFIPDVAITFREKYLADGTAAGVDGSGTYHPDTPELQEFLASNMALVNGERLPPVIQIRVWNPDADNGKGLFAKGLIVPDYGSLDKAGNPAVVLGLNQIKGVMSPKEPGPIKDALESRGEVVLKGHLGAMKVWKEQSTLKSCFELLQLAEETPETYRAVCELVAKTFESMRRKGPEGLVSATSGGNTTLERLMDLVRLAQTMGVQITDPVSKSPRVVQMMDIPAVRSIAMDKLRRRLYNAANGTGFEGHQVVIIMDASVKRGHVVIGSTSEKVPEAGKEVVTWRFPAILAQSLKTLTVQEPLPHMLVKTRKGDLVVVPYSVFMNPADVTDLQGDDDGDMAGWTTDPRVAKLARNLVDNRRYRIEPDGEKVKITEENMVDFAEYVSTDPMGPVGPSTVAQARYYELSQISLEAYLLKEAQTKLLRYRAAREEKDFKKELFPLDPRAWTGGETREQCLDAIREDLAAGKVTELDARIKAWKVYKDLAYSWARAFGVFIQECIDRAKRFVRWTDIPKLARKGDKGWATIGDGDELYCHWSWDENERRHPWKQKGLSESRTDSYLSLTDDQLRTVSPLNLLADFTAEAAIDLGEEVNYAVRWRRNFTAKGERLNKRIDPDNFQPRPRGPGLTEVAFAETQRQWASLAKEFKIPAAGADLSDLVERMLDHQEKEGKAPAPIEHGGRKMGWAEFIRLMKDQARQSYAERFAYSRVLWTTEAGDLDEEALSWLRASGRTMPKFSQWLPQAILDNEIRRAMILGFQKSDLKVDSSLGHNETPDDNPGTNPRIQAIEEAYKRFNHTMVDLGGDDAAARVKSVLARYAFEAALTGTYYRRDPKREAKDKGKVLSYDLVIQNKAPDPLAADKMQPVAKAERALDLLLHEGSPIAAHFGLVKKDACYYQDLPALLRAVRVIDEQAKSKPEGRTLAQARVEYTAKAIFSRTFLTIDQMAYPHSVPSTLDQVAEFHFFNTGKPLHQCEACTEALKKEIVNLNRYGGATRAETLKRLTDLAANLTTTLRSDQRFAVDTHFEHLRIEMLKIASLSTSSEASWLSKQLKSANDFRIACYDVLRDVLAHLPSNEAQTGDHVEPKVGSVPFSESALATFLKVYGFFGFEQSIQAGPALAPSSDEDMDCFDEGAN